MKLREIKKTPLEFLYFKDGMAFFRDPIKDVTLDVPIHYEWKGRSFDIREHGEYFFDEKLEGGYIFAGRQQDEEDTALYLDIDADMGINEHYIYYIRSKH